MSRNLSNRALDLHEIAFSVNVALAFACWVFIWGPINLQHAVGNMDRTIYTWLGIVKIDPHLRHGTAGNPPFYFALVALIAPVITLMWISLRLSRRSKITRRFLSSGAGIAAIAATPIVRLVYIIDYDRRYGEDGRAFVVITGLEVVFALAIGLVYLWGPWRISDAAVVFVLVVHYGFWFLHYSSRFFLGQFADPAGLCAALVWVYYLRQQRNENVPA